MRVLGWMNVGLQAAAEDGRAFEEVAHVVQKDEEEDGRGSGTLGCRKGLVVHKDINCGATWA